MAEHQNNHHEKEGQRNGAPRKILPAIVFGAIFGFLLQKGGVAKYEVLMGVLLLEDLTVIRVMGTAILVGMIGVLGMHRLGMVKLHLRPTRYAANVGGGLIFGIGFGLAAYCPGTAAAALGQGNYDAIGVVLGLIAGSYVYALASDWLGRHIKHVGERGQLVLPQLLHLPRYPFAMGFALLLLATLMALSRIRGA